MLDIDSGQVTELTSNGKDPSWSPDGRFVAYVTDGDRAYYSEEMWIVPANGGESIRVGQGGFPGWSSDGRTVYFHERNQNVILAANVDRPAEKPKVFFENTQSWYPAISQDGSRIAFGARERLVVVDRASGETVAEIETPGQRGLLPSWSPDGRQVAFGGFVGADIGVWIFDVERGEAFQVAQGFQCTMPVYSPDGKRLAFDYRGNPQEIWVINVESLPAEPAYTNQLPSFIETTPTVLGPAVTDLVGKSVPGPFKLELLEGGEFVLPDSKTSNVLLLDFWATWCGPCRQVMPVLAEVARDYSAKGVRYVAVNLRENPEVIRRYLTSSGLDLTVALDRDGEMARAFNVSGIPTMVVVDRSNIVREVHVGASSRVDQELRTALDELLSHDNKPPELR